MDNKIKPHLQKYPHIPDEKTKHDPRFNNKYISIQDKVNNDSEFEKKYFKKLVDDGWVALKNVEQIFIYPSGKLFKYRLNGNSLSNVDEGTFRSGGFLIGKNMDDPDNNHKYFLYKAFNGAIFSLQIKDILEIYIKSKKKDVINFKVPHKITKFPVFLKSTINDDFIPVYYARDSFDQNRFINSLKYKKALNSGFWSFNQSFS